MDSWRIKKTILKLNTHGQLLKVEFKGDKTMDAYTEFAYIYDRLMEDIDYNKWLNFIKDILQANNMRPKDVLEMGCGTGNFTRLLCQEGYNVIAFDSSEDMLSVAYNKLNPYRNVQLIKQDMLDFKINKEFHMIVSVCDSINYISEYSQLIKVFNNVYSHLMPGGAFIFDINSFYKLKNIIGNNVFIEDNEEVFYVWENEYDEIDNTCQFYISFFVKDSDKGLYRRFNELHVEKAYTSSEIETALRKSGFSIISVYDEYSRKIPNPKSERLTFLAIK